MGRISENAIDVLESLGLYELGISVRGKASVVLEEADFLCPPLCISYPNDLEIKRKRNARPVMNLDDQYLESDHVETVQTVQKEQEGNNVWRSGGSFFPKSKSIISLCDSLLKVFMIFVILMDVRGDLVELPENNAIRANETAIMKCKTSSPTKPIIWTATDHNNGLLSIYDGEKVNPIYQGFVSVTPSAGRYDLLVKATSHMALAYKCIEPGAENIERTAELIVLESDPTCVVTPYVPNYAANTEFIDLVCNMRLSGNWIPSLTWRVNGIQEPLTALNHTQRLDGQRVIVTSTLSNVSRNDKQKYLCEAYFSLESRTVVSATNVPGYKYTCTARDLPPTFSTTTLSPVTTTTSFPPPPPPGDCCKGFKAILAVFIIENVVLIIIGIIVYLYKNDWKLPFLKKKTRADEGSPPMLKDGENSKPAPTKPSAVSSFEF